LVTEEELPRAVALNSAQFNLSRVLGPAVAGTVIAVWGASICYGANLISFIPFFLSLYWIYPKTQPGRGAPASLEAPVRFSEFFDLLKDKKVLFPLATIFTSTLLCSPVSTFAPVVVKDVFNGDASQVGQTMAAFGIGGVLGAVFFISKSKFLNSLRATGLVAIVVACGIASAFVITSLLWIKIIMGLTGAGMAVVGTMINSILQKTSDNHHRGRVISLFQFALHGGMGLGSLLLGVTSSWLGIQTALVINGIAAVLVQIFIMLISKGESHH
ncbi:MAG: MFS transporter, partial [Pseudobdellovibrio sp.]